MEDAKQESSVPAHPRIVLAKPRLGGFGASSSSKEINKGTSNTSSASVLRPPQLKPFVGSNPFHRPTQEQGDSPIEKDTPSENATEEKQNETNEEMPKFVPLGSSNATARTNTVPAPSARSTGFVFGQNLSERVVKPIVNNGTSEEHDHDHSSSNGNVESEMLFSRAAASTCTKTEEGSSAGGGSGEGSSSSSAAGTGSAGSAGGTGAGGSGSGSGLAAAAAEWERARARPPPPCATHTPTGEEGETNVLQISCKLFMWECGEEAGSEGGGGGRWVERGRGALRLNDGAGDPGPGAGSSAGPSGGGSRVIVRVAGSHRVVLNTKLWAGMVLQRPSATSLTITAIDDKLHPKLCLIMAAASDIGQLHKALQHRVALCKPAAAPPAAPAAAPPSAETPSVETPSAAVPSDRLEPAEPTTTPAPDSNGETNIDIQSEDKMDAQDSVDKEDNKALATKRKESDGSESSPKRVRSEAPNE